MKGKLNPDLEVGDKIICLHMEGEISVPPGTIGTVTRVVRDPFESDGKLIEVDWENGSRLSIVSTTDAWKIIPSEPIQEQIDPNWGFISSNEDLFEHFDWRFFRKFLTKMRDSGIVNMFGASPLIYAGPEHLERYYGEGREDDETFQELLEMSKDAKNKMIQGVLSYMEAKNKDLNNLDMVNKFARHFAQQLLGIYITFANMTNNLD